MDLIDGGIGVIIPEELMELTGSGGV